MSTEHATSLRLATGEASLSDTDFEFVAGFARQNFGLNLSDAKRSLVHSRISRRLRQLGLRSFADYRQLLGTSGEDGERMHLLSALTTNVTDFFRERHHFDTLRDSALPHLLKEAERGRRVRIWSAGCSTGQEPYSIAMTLLDASPTINRHDVRVLATDIDPVVVETAEKGVYRAEDFGKLSPDQTERYLDPLDAEKSRYRFKDAARNLISFGVLNLISPLPVSGPFDVIFCRNVAIYFDKPTQQSIWKKFFDVLADDGYLFIGHSERITGDIASSLINTGITTYRKSGATSEGRLQLDSRGGVK